MANPNPSEGLFNVHKLNEEGMVKAEALKAIFVDMLWQIEEISGADGRDMAIVRTKLQEASFFAKRAMAVKPENQEP